MGETTVPQNRSKSRRVIDIVVLLVIILGIILVLAELVTNILPVLKGKFSASSANQVQVITALDKNLAGPAPTEASETNETK